MWPRYPAPTHDTTLFSATYFFRSVLLLTVVYVYHYGGPQSIGPNIVSKHGQIYQGIGFHVYHK